MNHFKHPAKRIAEIVIELAELVIELIELPFMPLIVTGAVLIGVFYLVGLALDIDWNAATTYYYR